MLQKLEEEGLHQAVRSTTSSLEEIPPPSLEDIAKREEELQKQRDLARLGRSSQATAKIQVASERLGILKDTASMVGGTIR